MAEAYRFNGPIPEAVKRCIFSDLETELTQAWGGASPTPAELLE